MGINTILILIAGIVMSTIVASQVAPSIVEGVKVKKTQVQTINNQEVIFEAIKRYTTIKQVAPTSMTQLISAGYIDAKVNDNGFGGTYTFSVSTTTGVATIKTTIVDPKAQEAFLNSFMGTSKPTRVGATNNFETKFVLPNEVMHGNALLMTGIPIQATPPDSNINKYWYDTSSGKATLKLYDGTSWVEVNVGGSGDDSTNVKLSGDQTIDGVKTFTSSPKAPTPATSDNSTNLATTQFVKNLINSEGFTQSLNNNGWTKFPNGLIVQWGIVNIANKSSRTINFSISFPNNCASIMATPLSDRNDTATEGIYFKTKSKNNAVVYNSSNPDSQIMWIAGVLEITCQSDKIQILRVDNARRKTNRF